MSDLYFVTFKGKKASFSGIQAEIIKELMEMIDTLENQVRILGGYIESTTPDPEEDPEIRVSGVPYKVKKSQLHGFQPQKKSPKDET